MADTRKYLNEEFEIILKVKVKLTCASFYGDRTEEQLDSDIQSVKRNMKKHLFNKLTDNYSYEQLGDSVGGYINYNYDVEPSE